MTKKIAYTYAQLNSLASLHDHCCIYDPTIIPSTPEYAWLREMMDDETTMDYWQTGFNGDHLIDFAFWRYKPTGLIDALNWAKNFVKYHWIDWTYKWKLKRYGFDRYIPTVNELFELQTQGMIGDEYDPYRDGKPAYDDCLCRGAGACIQCNPRMFI